jgi:hypothetical protein
MGKIVNDRVGYVVVPVAGLESGRLAVFNTLHNLGDLTGQTSGKLLKTKAFCQ